MGHRKGPERAVITIINPIANHYEGNTHIPLHGRTGGLHTPRQSRPCGGGRRQCGLPTHWGGFYRHAGDHRHFFRGGGLTITLSNLVLRVNSLTSRTPAGPDERDAFDTTLLGDMSVNGSPTVPASGSGPTLANLVGKWGNTTGTFDTEMLQLDMNGTSPYGPFLIRESPTKQSLGQTTITNLGGGGYQIDSFFDVFTELSIDGGATWMPQSVGGGPNPVHFDLGGAVPEPTALGLLGLSLLGAMRRSRRVA